MSPLRAFVALLTSFVVAIQMISSVHGGELPPEHAAQYMRLSLLNPSGVLRKISKAGPITVRAICVPPTSEKCDKSVINRKINDALPRNSRIRLKVALRSPDITILHMEQAGLANRKKELSKFYYGGFSDSDDLDCQLYYSLKNNEIQKLVIVVSLDSANLKQRLCLASQIYQGFGLSLPDGLSFTKLWQTLHNGGSSHTEELVAGLVKGFKVLEYIHMCPDIKPGMMASDLGRHLVDSSSCIDGIHAIVRQK